MSDKERNNWLLGRILIESDCPISTEMWEKPDAPRKATRTPLRPMGPGEHRGWLGGILAAGIWRSYRTVRAAFHWDL